MVGWLAGLDAFVVGGAYLVALLASRFVIRPLLVAILGSAPFVGGWLAANVDSGIGAFEAAITPAANASMGTIVSAVDWVTLQTQAVLDGLGGLGDSVYAWAYNLGAVTLPYAVGQALTQAEGLINDARGYALGLFQQAERDAGYALSQAEAAATQGVLAVEGELRSEIGAATSEAGQLVALAEQRMGVLFQQAEYDAGQLVAAAESNAAVLIAQARADLGAAVGAVEHDLQALAAAERVALEDSTSVLGGDIQAAEARAKAALEELATASAQSIAGIVDSKEWQLLKGLTGSGDILLKAAANEIIAATFKALRERIAQVPALRAQAEPVLESVLGALKADLG